MYLKVEHLRNYFWQMVYGQGDHFLKWGDQGDGRYANPIRNGDFADSDIEKLATAGAFSGRTLEIRNRRFHFLELSALPVSAMSEEF